MKNRSLLFSFLAVIFGVGVLLLTTAGIEKYQNRTKESKGISESGHYMNQIRSNQVTGTVDLNDVLAARKQALALNSKAVDMEWVEQGPDNQGARVRALIIDNQDATGKTLYAAGVTGGIWKSTTGGLTWNKVGSEELNLYVSCMAQAADGTIYAGTGESFLLDGDDESIHGINGFMGQGIYKSTNDGFELLSATQPASNNTVSDWAFINELAIDANGRVFAATNTGVKFSENGGESWSLVKTTDNELLDQNATEVKIAADNTIAVVVDNKCYISDNGLVNNFVLRSSDEEGGLPINGAGRIEIAFAADANIVYALLANGKNSSQYGELNGIYLSEDKGLSWVLIGPGGSANFNVFGEDNLGNYANSITILNDPYEILIGGEDIWKGVKVNVDGYFNWSKVSLGIGPQNIHQMIPAGEQVLIASDNGIHVTSDLINFQMRNRGLNITQCYTVNCDINGNAFAGTQGQGTIYLPGNLNSPLNGVQIYGGNGGEVVSSTIFPDFYIASRENADMIRFDGEVSQAFLGSVSNSNSFATPFSMWESYHDQNNADSATFKADRDYTAGEQVVVLSHNRDFPFNYTLDQDLAEGESVKVQDPIAVRFFVGVNGKVWMAREVLDFTETPKWYEISNTTTGFSGHSSCVAHSADGNHVWVGTEEGKVFRVSNIDQAIDSLTYSLGSDQCVLTTTMAAEFEGRMVTSIAVDPENVDNVVVTLGNYGNDNFVYRSTDATADEPTFTSIQGNLPKMPVYSSLVVLEHSNIILLGTEMGVYATDDVNAGEWGTVANGMGNVPVTDLYQQIISKPFFAGQPTVKDKGAIYAASYGRGVFKSNNYVGFEEIESGNMSAVSQLNIFPNPASTQATVAFDLNDAQQALVRVFDFTGKMVKINRLNNLLDGENKVTIDCNDLQAGTYLVQVVSGSSVTSGKFVVVK